MTLPRVTANSGCCKVLGPELPLHQIHVAEVFGGHIGGWTAASEVIPGWHCDVSLDHSPHAVSTCCRNHGGVLVDQPQHLTAEIAQQHLVW